MLEEKIEEKLNEVFMILEEESFLKELESLKLKLMSNSSFLELLNKYQTLDSYSSLKDELKNEIYLNEDYLKYQTLENELFFLILSINQKFSVLIDKKGCIR
ncbi:MAG: hypothetical protein E7168_01370 [Firmicutes bacterium]|nr:hypothetical protein [Bacillota bacterium]